MLKHFYLIIRGEFNQSGMFRSKKYHVQMQSGSEIDDGLFTLGEKEASRFRPELNRRNARIAWIFVFILFLFFFGRMYYLNIVKGNYYEEKAMNNKIREYSLSAPRGKIFDRTGKALVQNVPSTNVVAIASYLPAEGSALQHLIQQASSLFSTSEEEISGSFSDMKKVVSHRLC